MEEHRAKGGMPEKDVAYQYLSFFLDDDEKLKQLHDVRIYVCVQFLLARIKIRISAQDYKSGKLLTGEMKMELIKVMVPLIEEFQKARQAVTDDIVRTFMTPRRLCF